MDSPDQRAQDYKSGWDARGEHNTPSPETRERMQQMRHEVEDLRREVTDGFTYLKEQAQLIVAQTTKTNGRVTALETIQSRAEGGATVLKGIWGLTGIYVIAASFGLFQMYVQFQTIDSRITEAVTNALEKYENR